MKLKKFVILITMAILAIPAFSQVKASGVVIADGEPAIGATVQVKGQPSIGAAIRYWCLVTLVMKLRK